MKFYRGIKRLKFWKKHWRRPDSNSQSLDYMKTDHVFNKCSIQVFHGNWNIDGSVLCSQCFYQSFQHFPSFSLADAGEYLSVTQFLVKFDNVKALTLKGTPSSMIMVRSTVNWIYCIHTGSFDEFLLYSYLCCSLTVLSFIGFDSFNFSIIHRECIVQVCH